VRRQSLWLAASPLLVACSGFDTDSVGILAPPMKQPPPPVVPSIPTFMEGLRSNRSCALSCDPTCNEADTPWVCPALAAWDTIPHDPSCGSFDGTTMPAVVKGKCTATTPSGRAAAAASRTGNVVLPDGRSVAPAGTEWVFDESDLPGGFPAHALLVPGGRWLVVSDDGYDTNALRVVDTTVLLAGGTTSPVVSEMKYDSPSGLSYGLAYATTSNVLYASGNLSNSKILAFALDTTTGALTEQTSLEIALPAGTLPQAIDISPDETALLVSQSLDYHALVYSLASATYGKQTSSIELGDDDTDSFALHFDPNDATGQTAYTTMWTTGLSPANDAQMPLLELDLGAGKATAIAVGKAPGRSRSSTLAMLS
jgi:DNA-binding beta-propeller fold protein YncE